MVKGLGSYHCPKDIREKCPYFSHYNTLQEGEASRRYCIIMQNHEVTEAERTCNHALIKIKTREFSVLSYIR
jgi:hypothetical protein